MNFNDIYLTCKDYYKTYGRIPGWNEKVGDIPIGEIVLKIRMKGTHREKSLLRHAFNVTDPGIMVVTMKERLQLCREFYDEFHRKPNSKDPPYKGSFNVYHFIHNNFDARNEIEEIFKFKIRGVMFTSDNNKINICKRFYRENHRQTKSKEMYEDFKIGQLINNIGRPKYLGTELRTELENIFGNLTRTERRKTWEEKLELCSEFFNLYGRFPSISEKYKHFRIGAFTHRAIERKNDIVLAMFR